MVLQSLESLSRTLYELQVLKDRAPRVVPQTSCNLNPEWLHGRTLTASAEPRYSSASSTRTELVVPRTLFCWGSRRPYKLKSSETNFALSVGFQFGTTVRLKSMNACYHSAQNLLSSRLQNHNFSCYFTWVWNVVAHTKIRTQAEGILEQCAEEDIWTYNGRGNRVMKKTT